MALKQGVKIGIIVAVVVVLIILLVLFYFGLKNTVYEITKSNMGIRKNVLGQEIGYAHFSGPSGELKWHTILGIPV
jgi:hypothetical protein